MVSSSPSNQVLSLTFLSFPLQARYFALCLIALVGMAAAWPQMQQQQQQQQQMGGGGYGPPPPGYGPPPPGYGPPPPGYGRPPGGLQYGSHGQPRRLVDYGALGGILDGSGGGLMGMGGGTSQGSVIGGPTGMFGRR